MKRIICVLLAAALLSMSGCAGQTKISDNYRSYYEIFVHSFADSNGDGVGDINGITAKLDYLNDNNPKTDTDLGVDGIWLMPVFPSPTYHKYDASDYKSVDSSYGTPEDIKTLLAECDKRDIKVIIDLALNHTSVEHPWFKQAVEGLKGEKNKYTDYYNFTTEAGKAGYSQVSGTDYYYECVFWDGMPDLNLDNEDVRAEIADIIKYWLDMGVDGFRLDAVIHYYANNTQKNKEFLKWLTDTAHEINKDAYFVCEAWTDESVIADYYSCGVDSMFNFPFSQADGRIVKAVQNQNGNGISKAVADWNAEIKAKSAAAIDAPFLSNHDNARIAGALMTDLIKEKLAANIYQLMPGNSFIYYGEELGMKGSGADPNKRLPMVWQTSGADETTLKPPGTDRDFEQPQGVAEQQADEGSLLNHYKKLIKVKSELPEIMRGTPTAVDIDNKAICAYESEYNGDKALIIHNLGESTAVVSIDGEYKKIAADLSTNGEKSEFNNNQLTLPPRSSAVLK